MKGEDLDSLLDLTVKTLSDRVIDSYQVAADYTTPDAEMLTRLVRDVWHFSGAKSYQEMRDLTLLLKDDNGKLREFEDFKQAAEGIIDKYNETWLRTEYNFAVSSSQNAARWVEFEKEAGIIPNLKYQTVGDDHVRASHQVLDGIIRPVNDSFWITHYPPNGWGCRCEVVQSLEGYGKVTPDKDIPVVDIPKMFKTNLAKTGLIYPKNHPYYNGVPKAEISKALAYLPPENTFIDIKVNGCHFEIHPLHGEKELGKNINAVTTLLKKEPDAKVKLMPIISENNMDARKKYYPKEYLDKFPTKNADILYNKKVAEIEIPSGSKRSIQHAVEHGIAQADTVFICIPDSMDINDAYRIVNGHLKHYPNNNSDIWLINNNEKVQYKRQKR
ncbi:hypothetical protein D0T84_01285 [Dysgonomonas sp. 521]|uniref:phage head morphogenesis protein n=1 Tax=Dysgonomonas sp. 521 TaxID=2302932 RepID=UPI0013D4B287|nr:phage minor head protein [Dysgonomonas sp. 521]NDV93550.1 hypothetical protein [Dysgonomonas sp. 521]